MTETSDNCDLSGDCQKCDLWVEKCVLWGLGFLAVGTFTSAGLAALSQPFFIIAGFYFLHKEFKHHNLKATPRSVWAMLFIFITCILSSFVNLDILVSTKTSFFKARYFLIAFLSYFALKGSWNKFIDTKWQGRMLKLFLLSTNLASLSGILALYTGFNYLKMKPACHYERACGVFGMYMTYGYGIALLCTLLLWALIYREKLKAWVPAWVIIVSFIINFAGLFLSYTRGAWGAFFISAPFIFFRRYPKKFALAIVVTLLTFGLSYSFIPSVKKMFEGRSDSTMQRVWIYKTAIKAFEKNPLFGLGFRNFEPLSKEIKKEYDIPDKDFQGHAHNNFLEHLASTGLLGFLAVVIWHLLWGLDLWKSKNFVSDGVLAFLLTFFISGQVQYTFGDSENLFLILSVFALSLQKQKAQTANS